MLVQNKMKWKLLQTNLIITELFLLFVFKCKTAKHLTVPVSNNENNLSCSHKILVSQLKTSPQLAFEIAVSKVKAKEFFFQKKSQNESLISNANLYIVPELPSVFVSCQTETMFSVFKKHC